jgi:hypothetical protein
MNNSININDDELDGQNKKNPFETDHAYFEKLNLKIQNRIEEYEELSDMAPLLSAIPKYNPFETPKAYFDELPTSIQEQVIKVKNTVTIKELLIQIFQPRFFAPVLSVLIVAFTGIHYLNTTKTSQTISDDYSIYEELEHIDELTLIEEVVALKTTETTDENEQVVDYLLENELEEIN